MRPFLEPLELHQADVQRETGLLVHPRLKATALDGAKEKSKRAPNDDWAITGIENSSKAAVATACAPEEVGSCARSLHSPEAMGSLADACSKSD